MYEESARVPLIIKFPKDYTPQVRETDELVSHIDVFPKYRDRVLALLGQLEKHMTATDDYIKFLDDYKEYRR